MAKNNFCASNIPVEVNIATLRSLESRTQDALNDAGISFGSPTTIPPNRHRLRQGFTVSGQTFREGMAVFIRAFGLDAHYSNLGKGESVNCKVGKKPNNDIHISLGATPGSEECNGVNAEISPHFRPTTWADFDDYLFTNPVMIMANCFMMRVTGHAHQDIRLIRPASAVGKSILFTRSKFAGMRLSLLVRQIRQIKDGCPSTNGYWNPTMKFPAITLKVDIDDLAVS